MILCSLLCLRYTRRHQHETSTPCICIVGGASNRRYRAISRFHPASIPCKRVTQPIARNIRASHQLPIVLVLSLTRTALCRLIYDGPPELPGGLFAASEHLKRGAVQQSRTNDPQRLWAPTHNCDCPRAPDATPGVACSISDAQLVRCQHRPARRAGQR
ncbi:hypothetical protein OH77DRAFT_372 [Trametes cingulata]|nr:hypothetical protein OH77DRAFT_372 [Trametes cingulata]